GWHCFSKARRMLCNVPVGKYQVAHRECLASAKHERCAAVPTRKNFIAAGWLALLSLLLRCVLIWADLLSLDFYVALELSCSAGQIVRLVASRKSCAWFQFSCLAKRSRRCWMLPSACMPWHCGVWFVLRCWFLRT
ncbi:hypothetical protein A2U01_0021881, partial [Trifolium medium]|nr:hypothetical protein [Trifolium medium]